MRHRVYWLSVIIAYWLCGLWLLFRISPISVDGSGPTPTWYWESPTVRPPAPTLFEYEQNRSVRLQFLYPYWGATSIVTICACLIVPGLVRWWRPRRSRLFLASAATTLGLLLLAAAISDIGNVLRLWRGPSVYAGVSYFWPFFKFAGPMSLLAGIAARIRNSMESPGPGTESS